MKKKLLSMTLGMMLVISAAVPAMAAPASTPKEFPATAITVASTALVKGEYKEGLNVLIQISEQTQDAPGRLLTGIISKEDALSVMNDLGFSQAEKDALLKNFDKSMDIQKELYALYEGTVEQGTLEKADKLREDIQGMFNKEFLDKATEKGILSDLPTFYAASLSEATVKSSDTVDLKADKVELNVKTVDLKENIQLQKITIPDAAKLIPSTEIK